MNLKLLEDRIIPYSYQTSLDIIGKGLYEVTQNRDKERYKYDYSDESVEP